MKIIAVGNKGKYSRVVLDLSEVTYSYFLSLYKQFGLDTSSMEMNIAQGEKLTQDDFWRSNNDWLEIFVIFGCKKVTIMTLADEEHFEKIRKTIICCARE